MKLNIPLDVAPLLSVDKKQANVKYETSCISQLGSSFVRRQCSYFVSRLFFVVITNFLGCNQTS